MGDDFALADDVEVNLCERVGGTLSFSQPSASSDTLSRNVRLWSHASRSTANSNSSTQHSSDNSRPKKIVFDIISAHTISDPGKKKYVSYTILAKTSPGLDNYPAVIERRYSDFLQLYKALRKTQLASIHDFNFPKKALVGNFTADVITERSRAFYLFLTLIYSNIELRKSKEFSDFLHYKEVRKAILLMKQGSLDDATPLLENAVFLQQKLADEQKQHLFWTLCYLVACLNSTDNLVEAQKYAEAAISHADENNELSECPLYLPLLQSSVHLWWTLGMEKQDLEEKLTNYRLKSPVNKSSKESLLDVVLKNPFPF